MASCWRCSGRRVRARPRCCGSSPASTGPIPARCRSTARTRSARGASERHVGFVFQHYALFRHMTVFENVAFGLRVQPRAVRKDEATIRARVKELLDLVQLDWLANRYPSQLSGGQRQRIALARALAIEPRILLLDEPFGALDAKVRKELRQWLRSLHSEIHVTSIFVTHDQEEALEVANRVVVMDKGRIEQIGTPGEVYDNPATAFVHGFIGESIVLPVEVSGGSVRLGGRPLNIAAERRGLRRLETVRPPPRHADRAGRQRFAGGRGAPCPLVRPDPAGRGRTVRRRGQDRDRDRRAPGPGTPGRRDRRPAAPPLPDFCRAGLDAIVIPGRCEASNPESRDSRCAIAHLSSLRARNDVKIGRRSPFSHGWYATTARPIRGIHSCGRRSPLSGFWRWAAAWRTRQAPDQPTMYLSMANGGATLDPQAAASMISLYRQNNGLGAVAVDPDLMKLAEAAVAGDGQPQQARPRRQGRRWQSGWVRPAIRPRWRSKMSRPAITRWRKRFPAGATRRRTGPICSKTVSQNWASRRVMLRTPSTRCSGRSFLHQPEPDPAD